MSPMKFLNPSPLVSTVVSVLVPAVRQPTSNPSGRPSPSESGLVGRDFPVA